VGNLTPIRKACSYLKRFSGGKFIYLPNPHHPKNTSNDP